MWRTRGHEGGIYLNTIPPSPASPLFWVYGLLCSAFSLHSFHSKPIFEPILLDFVVYLSRFCLDGNIIKLPPNPCKTCSSCRISRDRAKRLIAEIDLVGSVSNPLSARFPITKVSSVPFASVVFVAVYCGWLGSPALFTDSK